MKPASIDLPTLNFEKAVDVCHSQAPASLQILSCLRTRIKVIGKKLFFKAYL